MSSREPVGHWPLGANRWDHGVDDPSTIEAEVPALNLAEFIKVNRPFTKF